MNQQNNRALRVLMVSPQFRPLTGGYERAAERLSAALVENGIYVVVITEHRNRDWPRVEHLDGYVVRRLFCFYRPHFHILTGLLSLAGFLLLHGRSFDVWHVHQYGYHAALAVALSKFLSRPVIIKLTSSAALGIEKTTGRHIVSSLLGFLQRQASACIVISPETRTEAIRYGFPSERVFLLPNGISSRQFCPASPHQRQAARRELGLVCDRLVLNVGRLSAEKNPLGLLEAWRDVDPEARAGVLLALVGDGPELDNVRAKVQALNLAGSIHLAGHCSEVATWYRAADLYVIPSHIEGLSNSMIEAMASGLPVVSTRVSGSSTLSEEPAAGMVVNVGDTKAIAAAIEALLTNESMRVRLSKNARLKFEARFAMEIVSRNTMSLYQGLRFSQQDAT